MVRAMDRALADYCRADYCRADVTQPIFEGWISSNVTSPVTLRQRSLGDTQDGTTGFYTPTWTEITIDALLSFGPTSTQNLPVGEVGNLDGAIRTIDAIKQGDEFKWGNTYFKIVTAVRKVIERDGNFVCYKAGFREQELRS